MAKKLDLLINAASMQYCMIKLFQNFISSGDEEKYRSIFRKIDMFFLFDRYNIMLKQGIPTKVRWC